MGFALILIGLVLTIAGARDTQGDLFTLLKGDLTGSGSFLWWAASVGAIGALGYAPSFQQLSRALLALIFVVLILSNKGVFENFMSAIKSAGNNSQTSQDTSSNGLPALPPLPPLGKF